MESRQEVLAEFTSYRGSSDEAATLRPVMLPGSVMTSLMIPVLSEVFESGPYLPIEAKIPKLANCAHEYCI